MSDTQQKCNDVYNCANCNKIYKRANGLLKHNKTCIPKEKEVVVLVLDNKDSIPDNTYDSSDDSSSDDSSSDDPSFNELTPSDIYDSPLDTSHCLTPKKLNDALNYHEFLENCDGPIDLDEFVKIVIMQIMQQNFSIGKTREEIIENIMRIKNSLKSTVRRINKVIEKRSIARLQHKENNAL
jgi:hypothetical protein